MKNPGIYILTSPSGRQYVGRDTHLPTRIKQHLRGNSPRCRLIHRAIQKYGRNTFTVEIIQYPGISEEALDAVERWWIRRLQTLAPSGYNLTAGAEHGSSSEETRQKMREIASERVANGTHHFLDSEIQRRAKIKRDAVNKKRLEDGTHNFLDSELQRRANKQRIEAGTHNFLGSNNPSHKRVEAGTHNFFDPKLQKKRLKALRESNHKRVADGTHQFLSGEISRRSNKKRLEDGTHHFLGESNPIKRLAKEGRHPSTRKRQKAEWCYIVALSRFWYEIHDYTLKRRAEFLSKDIPDTSKAEQEYLF